MDSNIIRTWNGRSIRVETRSDGRIWGCLTDMTQATGKLVADYLRLKSTEKYLEALQADMGIPISEIMEVKKGGNDKENQGVWGIDEVVIDCAAWCNVQFRVWCNRQIKDLLLTGHVDLGQPNPKIEPLKRETQALLLLALADSVKRKPSDRAEVTLQAHLMNAIESSQQAEATPQLLSVTEVLEMHGIPIPKGKDSAIGRKVAAAWRSAHQSDPQICAKHVGTGHRTAEIKVYPQEFFERIIAIAQQYLQ